VPGDVGPAVIAGHVDSKDGKAVFYDLYQLRTGDEIQVLRGGQWVTFQVTGTEQYAKSKFPTNRVYGNTPGAELRLITCGGEFDRTLQSYRDNIVVFAMVDWSRTPASASS
jgi:LPXTG-site transpeptidase (sortase) family protein